MDDAQRELYRKTNDLFLDIKRQRFRALAQRAETLIEIFDLCLAAKVQSYEPPPVLTAVAYLRLARNALETAAAPNQCGYNFGAIETSLEAAVGTLEDFESHSKTASVHLAIKSQKLTPFKCGRLLWASQELLREVRAFQEDLKLRHRAARELKRQEGNIKVLWGLEHA